MYRFKLNKQIFKLIYNYIMIYNNIMYYKCVKCKMLN